MAHAGDRGGAVVPRAEAAMMLVLRSPAFPDFGCIPERFARVGEVGVSPPLVWWDAPPCTRSFAVVCDDLDAPEGERLRWALCDIPPEKRELAEGYPRTRATRYTCQGTNDFGHVGYFGGGPDGTGTRHFRFRLFALRRSTLGCAGGASARVILGRAMESASEVAQLIGARSSSRGVAPSAPFPALGARPRGPTKESADRASPR